MHKPVFLYTVYPVGRLVGWMMCILLMMGASVAKSSGDGSRPTHLYFRRKGNRLGSLSLSRSAQSARLSRDPEVTLMVNRIGQRIAKAANKPEYVWEFAVIQDDEQINAFALPGGKVAVFTGILNTRRPKPVWLR